MSGEMNEYLFDLTNSLVNEYKRKKDEVVSILSAQEEPESTVLKLKSAQFDTADSFQHNTSKYEITTGENPVPVLRRGQPFSLSLVFDRPFQHEEDLIYMVLEYGPSPSFSNGSKFKVPVLDHAEYNHEQWAMWLTESKGPAVKVQVRSPVNSIVGLWRFKIEVSNKTVSDVREYDAEEHFFYLLFNPWCTEDEVYMENETWREGYVLRDQGVLFRGTINQQTTFNWVYGQFDYSVLSAIILLLEHSKLPHHQRGSATLMARALAALINSNDDQGLLVGRWLSAFNDGNHPDNWTGSTAIFDQYFQSKGTPVKYGQCWVFAGCLATACRALGIPCRPVTCYNSAHDFDKTLTIDRYLDANRQPIEKTGGEVQDRIWNYHCWNEVWITRPDLPTGYEGWQALDATPQETSMGMMVCGPSPVKAVKEGILGLKYDVEFVFSEVNGDVLDLQQDDKSHWGWTVVGHLTNFIGVLVATLNINSQGGADLMEDITNSYKYPEGSPKEREIFCKALKQMPNANTFFENFYKTFDGSESDSRADVKMTLQKINSIVFGDSFQVVLMVENRSEESRKVNVHLAVHTVLYTGKKVAVVKEGDTNFDLNPKETKSARLPVSSADYILLRDSSFMKMLTNCTVVETRQNYSNEDVFEITRQKLMVEMPSSIKLDEEFQVVVSIHNPLSEELTNCLLVIEGTGMKRPEKFSIPNVPVGGEMKKDINIVPTRLGERFLTAIFTSDQLGHASGSGTVFVKE